MQQEKAPGLRLDLACGQSPRPGFTGVDIWEGADIVCNLEQYPWPFEDASVSRVFCSHYIEHVPDLVSFANELFRIMKPGAKAHLIAPYYSSIRAWQDPTHVRAISERTFMYFNKEWREFNKLNHYPIHADFDFDCSPYLIHPDFLDKSDEEMDFARKHYINVIEDVQALLTRRHHSREMEELERQCHDLWGEGRYGEAAECCRQLLQAGAVSEEIMVMAAEFAFQEGRYQESLPLFQEVVSYHDGSLQAHGGLLRTLAALGRHDAAARHLAFLKQQDPGVAELLEMVAG